MQGSNSRNYILQQKLDTALDDAIEYYTEVIRLDPPETSTVSVAHYNRGVAYSEKGEVESAIRDYNQTIRLNPESAAAYNNRGYAYRQKGEIERAIEDYDRAIQIKSDNVLFLQQSRHSTITPARVGKSQIGLDDCPKYGSRYHCFIFQRLCKRCGL